MNTFSDLTSNNNGGGYSHCTVSTTNCDQQYYRVDSSILEDLDLGLFVILCEVEKSPTNPCGRAVSQIKAEQTRAPIIDFCCILPADT